MTAKAIDTHELESFLPLSPNTVELPKVSSSLGIPTEQIGSDHAWQAYIYSLAVAGFKQWLEDGAVPLPGISLSDDEPSNIPGINFQVRHFRLCIIATDSLTESSVEIMVAQSASTIEDAIAHLYVLVEVQEELNQVCIIAGLTRERLMRKVGRQAIRKGEALQLPASYFEITPEECLLYLSCLEPAPQTSVTRNFTTAVINTGCWLQNQLDELTEQLAWSLLPPLTTEMRPVREAMSHAIVVLSNQGVNLPLQARGVGGSISLSTYTFQMYAWVWPTEHAEDADWALFLLLGPQDGEILPEGLQLQVSDQAEILAQIVLQNASSEAYLYTQVQGKQQEQFSACIQLPGGIEMMLPAFSFESTL